MDVQVLRVLQELANYMALRYMAIPVYSILSIP